VPAFVSFYSTGLGWGSFSIQRTGGSARVEIAVTEGSLPLRSIRVGETAQGATAITLDGRRHPHQLTRRDDGVTLLLAEDVVVPAGGKLVVNL
jgi:hypothetical protein